MSSPSKKRAAGPRTTAPPPAPQQRPRSLMTEVGIIVLGVLLALLAQQAAEWMTWRERTTDARANLASDGERIVRWLGTREAASPCIDARLKELSAIVDAAAVSGRLPAVGLIGAPPRHAWTLPTWEMLTSGQALPHMPRDEVLAVTRLTLYLDFMRLARDAEDTDWGVIGSLRGPGRAFSEAEEAQVRAALSGARQRASNMRGGVHTIADYVVSLGWLSEAQMRKAWQEGQATGRSSYICQPIGSPAAGESILTDPPRTGWPPKQFGG